MHTYTYVFVHIRILTYMHICMHTSVCTHAHMDLYMYLYASEMRCNQSCPPIYSYINTYAIYTEPSFRI